MYHQKNYLRHRILFICFLLLITYSCNRRVAHSFGTGFVNIYELNNSKTSEAQFYIQQDIVLEFVSLKNG
jgi:hypothetical protein